MQTEDGVKKVARWVVLVSLFLLPLTPLIVTGSLFFPFITGKAFYLRILIEIAVCAWAVLALLDKRYRPRFSWIGLTVFAFVVWMFIADLFALNVFKAFWSNCERMEGWVLLIHLLGFFIVSSSTFRVEGKWRLWFLSSLGISCIISAYAVLQLLGAAAIHQGSTRIDASLGNSAYLAVYLLFNVFFALWLAFTENRNWLKWFLIILAAIEAILIFFTETRGAILGLIVASIIAVLLMIITAGKNYRRAAIFSLSVILVLIGVFYFARNSTFIQNNHVLQRIASISLADGQTRFTLWNMAFKGVAERPLIGWGQEGFNYVFNKYYDPSLYNQEVWFDRAHNAFIDWLSAGGIPAFVIYLLLFIITLVLLWKSSELSRPERIFLTAALIGYACHNFFVFDNLYSYIYFFALLALIDSQVSRPFPFFERMKEISSDHAILYAYPIALIVLCVLIWSINISGLRATAKLISAISPSSGSPKTNIAIFEDLAASPSFAVQEIREQLVSFATAVVQSQTISNEEKQRIASLAITEMQKQVASYPLDARERLQLSYAYRSVGDGENALNEIKTAIELSPRKEEMYIEAGALEFDRGNMKEAHEYFDKAYSLGRQFSNLAIYAAAGNLAVGNQSEADKILENAFGTTNIDSDILAAVYYKNKDWPRLLAIWKSRTEKPNSNVDAWFGLASVYYLAGDSSSAIGTINKAIKLFPEAASAGAAAIEQIKAKPANQ